MNMKMLSVILLCGYFLQFVLTDEQCELNDMKALIVTVNRLRTELQNNKEETLALKEEVQELKHLKLDTEFLQNQTEALDNRLKGNVAHAVEINSTLQTTVSKLNTSYAELNIAAKSHASEVNEIKTRLEATISELNISVFELSDTSDYWIDSFNETLGNVNTAIRDKTSEFQDRLEFVTNFTESQTTTINSTVLATDRITDEFAHKLNATLQNHTDALKTLQNGQGQNTNPAIGFAARTDGNGFYCNGTMAFQTVVFDRGGVFNNNTGYFTAPYSGTYLFSTQACFSGVYISIVSPTRGFFGKIWALSPGDSMTTVASLENGDEISVNCEQGSFVAENDSYRWTMFSGALLHIN